MLLFLYIVKKVVLKNSLVLVFLSCIGHEALAWPISSQGMPISKLISQEEDINWKNLIHYENEKSVINHDSNFFLSSNGYRNSKAEYLATLKELFESNDVSDEHVICRYPARFEYILDKLGLSKNDFPKVKCDAYEEYLNKVIFDDISIVFASESNTSPSSMMGHSFLKISGQEKTHAFSYFATFDRTTSFDFFIKAFVGGVNGSYVLSSYSEKENEYLYNEKRSLWEFKLKLNQEDKKRLKAHLWELKGKNIKYNFIKHNCNTALINILKIANKDFYLDAKKTFITPIEYIQWLQDNDKISSVTFVPSETQKNAIKKFGLNYIGDAPKPTRVSFSQDILNNVTHVELSPVYQDMRDISNAYFADLESKILDFSFSYYNKNKKFTVDKIDILKMESIIDFQTTNSFSKYFRIGFENDLFNETFELNPVAEFGLGFAKKIWSTSLFVLPKIGYHYDNFSNYYITPKVGIISRIGSNIKIINSYERYFSLKDNNFGFSERFNIYLGYKISKNNDFFIDYQFYDNAKRHNGFKIGVSLHF